MQQVRYSRYEGPEDEIDLEDLVRELRDHLLESGFNNNPWDPDPDAGRSMEDLLLAIAASLADGDMVPRELVDEALDAEDWLDSRLGKLAQRLAERLAGEGYVRFGQPGSADEGDLRERTFELTARTVEHLGGSALREIMGLQAGRLTGSHRTRQAGAGVETTSASRKFEFGDSLGLDAAETLRHAARRGAPGGRISVESDDLHVQESEFSSSTATVLLLDCSHSMILYGEDRFTPGKKVALALAHLIRTQYRGDTLRFVLFHDSAEEVTLPQLATIQVGPFHTNTAEGLRLARRLLQRQRADSRQIMMITDGKPTAVTLPGGRIYRNAYGQDRLVLQETLREVGACRRQGITINTFMLAQDPALLAFVRRVTDMTGGRAYMTSAADVGQFVLTQFSGDRRR